MFDKAVKSMINEKKKMKILASSRYYIVVTSIYHACAFQPIVSGRGLLQLWEEPMKPLGPQFEPMASLTD